MIIDNSKIKFVGLSPKEGTQIHLTTNVSFEHPLVRLSIGFNNRSDKLTNIRKWPFRGSVIPAAVLTSEHPVDIVKIFGKNPQYMIEQSLSEAFVQEIDSLQILTERIDSYEYLLITLRLKGEKIKGKDINAYIPLSDVEIYFDIQVKNEE